MSESEVVESKRGKRLKPAAVAVSDGLADAGETPKKSKRLKLSDDGNTVTVSFRLRHEERDELLRQRERSGKSISDFVREALEIGRLTGLRAPARRTRKADPELVKALAKIGNNVNQLAHASNVAVLAGTPVDVARLAAALELTNRQLERVVDASGA